MDKLSTILQRCRICDLEEILGSGVVKMISEFDFSGVSKKKILADTIVSAFAIGELLDNNNTRNKIFEHLANDKEDFENLSRTHWNRSENTEKICERLELNPEHVFPQITMSGTSTIKNCSNNDKFYELLDYQFLIKQRVCNELQKSIQLNRMLIQMPTGTGKTKTAMHIIIEHLLNGDDNTVIWMAHTTELLEQAYDTFIKCWSHLGFGDVKVIRYWGEANIKDSDLQDGKNIIFAGFQKLGSIKRKSSSQNGIFLRFIQKCTLLVVDEAHKSVADDTKDTINQIMVKNNGTRDRSLIGLTATPGRQINDPNDNNRLANMFDNKIFMINPRLIEEFNQGTHHINNNTIEDDVIRYLQQRRVLARFKKTELHYDVSEEEVQQVIQNINDCDGDFDITTINILAQNIKRNNSIVDKIQSLNSQNIPTILFSCSVDHGKVLSAILHAKNVKNVCVFGDMNPTSRAENISQFKQGEVNVIINFGVLTTGFDATNIRAVMITRPTKSVVLYSQMIGRGLRGPKMGGNEECELIDLKDNLGQYNESLAYKQFNGYWNI